MMSIVRKMGDAWGACLRARGLKKRHYRFLRNLYRGFFRWRQWSWPKKLTIETTTRCNLNCLMCAKGREDRDREKDFSAELLEKTASMAGQVEALMAHGIGEPLMGSEFQAILGMVPRDKAVITFNTNGTLLDDEAIESLLGGNVKEIVVSLDAATEKTYRMIRNYDFEKVVGNVAKLIRRRNERELRFPEVRICMTLMQLNIEEAVGFVELAKEIGADGVYFWHMNDGPGWDWVVERGDMVFDYQQQLLKHTPKKSDDCLRKAIDRSRELGIEIVKDWDKSLFFGEEEAGEGGGLAGKPKKEEALEEGSELADCAYPWEWLLVYTDGLVRFCCYSEAIGSLHDYGSLEEVWNCKEARKMRKLLAKNKMPTQCRRAACKYVKRVG